MHTHFCSTAWKCVSQTFHGSSVQEIAQSICAQHIDHPRCSPLVYHEWPEQTGDGEEANDEEKIQQPATMARTTTALHHHLTMLETVGQTSSTCFLVSADADQMTEFLDEIQSNQLQLHLGPCCIQKNTAQLKTN